MMTSNFGISLGSHFKLPRMSLQIFPQQGDWASDKAMSWEWMAESGNGQSIWKECVCLLVFCLIWFDLTWLELIWLDLIWIVCCLLVLIWFDLILICYIDLIWFVCFCLLGWFDLCACVQKTVPVWRITKTYIYSKSLLRGIRIHGYSVFSPM